MESLLQNYEDIVVTHRPVALSRKKNDVVPNELVDRVRSFGVSSTGSREVSLLF